VKAGATGAATTERETRDGEPRRARGDFATPRRRRRKSDGVRISKKVETRRDAFERVGVFA